MWLMVWKNIKTSSSTQPQAINIDGINKLLEKLSAKTKEASKTKDQLCAILDKIKEIKQSVKILEKDRKENYKKWDKEIRVSA